MKFSKILKRSRFAIPALVLFCSLFFIQCKKNLTTTSPSAKLSFTTTQLFFDTVFATIGSSVRAFVVHNNNSEAVVVSSIQLTGSTSSSFKINVDGVPGSTFSNIKIPAKDSIYVFATVTVNPSYTQNPAFIMDSLEFTTNGNLQSVELEAFGWNAYYYMPNVFPPSGPPYSVVSCITGSADWAADKPHVVYGYVLVPPGCTLNITQGAGVYLHDSAVIFVDSGATLNVAGTAMQPVTFQGDRLEPAYKYLPGQWNKIWLTEGSVNNNISWAVMQNGSIGVEADTVWNSNPTLTMDHTLIKGMSNYGLFGAGATIKANNCVIADCQYNCVFMWIGGSYYFDQCTFADYWGVDNSFGQRTTPTIQMNNYYQSGTGQNIKRNLNAAFFGNCIIYGALNEEVGLDSSLGAKFNYYFENCVIRTQRNASKGIHYDDSNWVNKDPLFNNPSVDNYEVNPGSPAIGNGNPVIATQYSVSIDNLPRSASIANIGAYQQ